MTNQSESRDERHWVVEPLGPGEISFQIAAGKDVEVTPELQTAFSALVETLRSSDVQGYAYDPKCTTKDFRCTNNGACKAESQYPCFIDYHCQIGKLA
ncbi:MAG TPA: hypothetical protein VK821_03030 [Dehalococcoidia bacterium]|nr:hypothetical protein [Dehalococcoidia bacterium]